VHDKYNMLLDFENVKFKFIYLRNNGWSYESLVDDVKYRTLIIYNFYLKIFWSGVYLLENKEK